MSRSRYLPRAGLNRVNRRGRRGSAESAGGFQGSAPSPFVLCASAVFRCYRTIRVPAILIGVLSLAVPGAAGPLPFGPGERIGLRITYARLLAGRAELSTLPFQHDGRPLFQFALTARSEGFFAWLFRFHVDDRTVALWDPVSRCSYGIEKHLREGRARRDQVVRIEPLTGRAELEDAKVRERFFQLGPCPLDVLSAFFVARARGLGRDGTLMVPVFDNGKEYDLRFQFLRRERLDLPPPFGRKTPTQVVEPLVPPGAGLFTQEGPLTLWATDDERRIPVRMRSKVAIGSVSADLEWYTPGETSSK